MTPTSLLGLWGEIVRAIESQRAANFSEAETSRPENCFTLLLTLKALSSKVRYSALVERANERERENRVTAGFWPGPGLRRVEGCQLLSPLLG